MEKEFILFLLIIISLILICLIMWIFLSILELIIDNKFDKSKEIIDNFDLKSIISHLENISEHIFGIASIKLTNKEKIYFVNEMLPKTNNYLKEQIDKLKRVSTNIKNLK